MDQWYALDRRTNSTGNFPGARTIAGYVSKFKLLCPTCRKFPEGDRVFYEEAELEPEEDDGSPNLFVRVGDDVDIASAESSDGVFIARIEAMYQEKGNMFASFRWFYRIHETILKDAIDMETFIGMETISGRRLWLAEDNNDYENENDLSCITRVVKVVHVDPGSPVPDDCEYWYNQTHTQVHYTFRDIFKDVECEKKVREKEKHRELLAIDLFSGCGGMSFVAQSNEKVSIVTKHAVDLDHDALLSFKANHLDSHIHYMGVEQFLMICKHMNEVHEHCSSDQDDIAAPHVTKGNRTTAIRGRGSAGNTAPAVGRYHDIVEIIDVKLEHCVEILDSGQGRGQLAEQLDMENSWIEFACRLSSGELYQSTGDELRTHHFDLLKEFACTTRDRIPRPGDIGLIMGGPPCQGVSGYNIHACRSNVLDSCPRNQQVKAFYRVIEFFKPAYTLMENVLDIFKKEEGIYAKYATAQLLTLGYQARMGIIAAGDHGAPQGRYRCFLWGAKSGEEVLPPFPQPTFNAEAKLRTTPIPDCAKCCRVDFLNEKDRENAWDASVLGDVLTDLPSVTNFCVSDQQEYRCEPQTPLQAWLRRAPPSSQCSRKKRARAADDAMRATCDSIRSKIMRKYKEGASEEEGMMNVGEFSLCCKSGGSGASFASQTLQTTNIVKPDYAGINKNGRRGLSNRLALANRVNMQISHGREIVEELEKARAATGSLRDHRPRICNSDDFVRIESVPKGEGAGYRSMHGVVVNACGTACAGSSHAFKGMGCEGNGVAEKVYASTRKEGRVDFSEKDGWRGTQIKGCNSRAVFLPSADLQCPRWCISSKGGKSTGRSQCYGRVVLDKVQPTVVTRAEPHNIQICHPEQNRTLTIRENARCQGFPDYYALVGTGDLRTTLSRVQTVYSRYMQIGNAVCPQVAMALGRGLLLSASGDACPATPVKDLPNLELNLLYSECGLKPYMAQKRAKCKNEPAQFRGNEPIKVKDEKNNTSIDPSESEDDSLSEG